MNYDVPSRRNLRPVAPQNFAHAAFNAVPHNRAAKGFLNADPESAGLADRERFCGGTFVRKLPPESLIRLRYLRAEENRVSCGDGALSVETCVSAKNSPPQSRQLD